MSEAAGRGDAPRPTARGRRGPSPELVALLLGIVLRCVYGTVTPIDVREHDSLAHIAYIQHVYRLGTLPSHLGGGENHQAPLYYFVAAGCVRAAASLGLPLTSASLALKALGTLLSCAGLAVALWLGRTLFPDPASRGRVLYAFLVAVLPAWILEQAGRVTNDVLAFPLALLLLALCLRWFKTLPRKQTAWLGIVLGLGLLTKTSFLALGAYASLLALLGSVRAFRPRVAAVVAVWSIALLLSGWYYVLRYAYQGQRTFIGSIEDHKTQVITEVFLRVPTDLHALTTFNPARVVMEPFNHVMSRDESRGHALEVTFRTALFDEYDFGAELRPWARGLAVFALAGLVLVAAGIGLALVTRWDEAWPLALLLALSVAALGVLRLWYPFFNHQTVRLAPWLMLPVAYFAALAGGEPRFRRWALPIGWGFVAASVLFFVRLATLS